MNPSRILSSLAERDADVARESNATGAPDRRAAGERLPPFLRESHSEELDQGWGVGVPEWRGAALAEPGPAGPTASTPTGRSPGPRAAYPGSAASSLNFTVNGHTSWQICRLTCYELPLRTGRRTTRSRSG
jgi:hypothetical protein